jgi:hypothetical protein
MRARAVLFGLLLVVAGAAAVLSFAALRDLARLCGFSSGLAWLLPVVVDAGAAAGSLVWLGGQAPPAAQRFARVLALGLLTLSVVANALGHGLEAYRLSPPWVVVVAVSAIAPAVLGAVVHLAVLVGRRCPEPDVPDVHEPVDLGDEADFDDEFLTEHGVSRFWADAPQVAGADGEERAAVLIAAGVGRRRLARELGMSEYEARQLLEQFKQRDGSPTEVDGDQE